MDIYSILASKPHNFHYLKRYISFITKCQLINVDYAGQTEGHHICPKANDMFPEYIDFKEHPWNKAELTPRQHFVAHLILWKVYPNFKSQTFAFWSMKWKNGSKINSRLYESLILDFRKLSSNIHKDTVTVKDLEGNSSKVSVNDPRFLSGELVGIQKGMVTVKDSDGNTHNISNKDPRYLSGEYLPLTAGTIGVKDKEGNTSRVPVDNPKYLSGELVAITTGMTWKIKDTTNYKKPKSKSHVENMKKWVSVCDPNTMEIKRILRTDPLYISGYYKGSCYGKRRSNEQKNRTSIALKGKKQSRCSCLLCGAEISSNNLDRHYGTRPCLMRSSTMKERISPLRVP
jgi:hypothetical protein